MKSIYNVLECMPLFCFHNVQILWTNQEESRRSRRKNSANLHKKKESTNQCEWQRKETRVTTKKEDFFFKI